MGLRFRLHRRDLPGSPDIVLPRCKVALFVHGCFWHQHPNCARARMPASNIKYWNVKLAGNRKRDRQVEEALKALGWDPKILWECEVRGETELADRLHRMLTID